jgi:hypothetical protein
MTDEELRAAHEALLVEQRRIRDGIHDLLNVLSIIKGEVDLAVQKARSQLDQFYRRYPDFL